MATSASSRRVTVDLPPWVVEKLEAEVKQGRYGSMEDAVLAGARLLAGLGPRAQELLAEGAAADEFIRADTGKNGGDWL
jgi:Arc/MetJ-type ribon-helix-helix transcriptional regulator